MFAINVKIPSPMAARSRAVSKLVIIFNFSNYSLRSW